MPEQTLSEFAKKVVAAKDKLRPRQPWDYEAAGERPDLALYPEFDDQVTTGHFTDKYVKTPEYKKMMKSMGAQDASAEPTYDQSAGPLYQAYNAAESWGKEHQLTPEQRMQVDAELMKAKNNAEMFAAPKVFWLEQNAGPFWGIARKAFEDMSKAYR